MKGSTVIAVGAVLVAGVVFYYLYQKKNSQLTIGANGVTGQINLSQAVGALGGLFQGVSNAFSGGHASSSGGFGNSQTSFMDNTGGVFNSDDGSTDDGSDLEDA